MPVDKIGSGAAAEVNSLAGPRVQDYVCRWISEHFRMTNVGVTTVNTILRQKAMLT